MNKDTGNTTAENTVETNTHYNRVISHCIGGILDMTVASRAMIRWRDAFLNCVSDVIFVIQVLDCEAEQGNIEVRDLSTW